MWLASTSLWTRFGKIIPTELWPPREVARAERSLREVLSGVGDENYERYFRMCITACFHRVLSTEELVTLPIPACDLKPKDLAGGPLEVFWERGVADVPSTKPCVNPRKEYLTDGRGVAPLYLPMDCGQCAPCRARAALTEDE